MADNVFQWDKTKFTVHVSAVDAEHEKLVGIMNRLNEENQKPTTTKAQLMKTIDELAKFTTEHFAHEEAFFSKIPDYKSAATHKAIHATLLKDFVGHVEKFKNSSAERLPNDFFMFLKVWLTAHICGVDRKFGELTKK